MSTGPSQDTSGQRSVSINSSIGITVMHVQRHSSKIILVVEHVLQQ